MDIRRSALYQLFIKEGKTTWARILFATVVAGLIQGGIVVVINLAAMAMPSGGLNLRYLVMFLALLGAYALASQYAVSRTIALTEGTILATYIGIADKLRHVGLLAFERLGKGHIYASLHTNTDIILETSKGLANVGAACVMILFSALYIASISEVAIATVVVFYLFGVYVYQANLGNMRVLLKTSEQRERRFNALFKYFLEGFKEIKVNHPKGADLFDHHIHPAGQEARECRVEAERRLTTNSVFIQSFYYMLVAAMIFLLPRLGGMSDLEVLQVAAVVLFSYGSMTRIVQAIPLILKAEKAVGALHALEQALESAREPAQPYSGRFDHRPLAERAIHLREASFNYPFDGQDAGFNLGPVSLTIQPGELLLIVGGNGTGKTTLLKLLAGLYPPQSGQLLLGEQPIDDSNANDYRNLFAVVFPDYYLFERFYGHPEVDDERLRQALQDMGLAERVSWTPEGFGDLNLSAGQSKRLALVCAEMEARPVLLLDEVAADLDPAFRRFFYETHLPALKASGKTIIAVSHDDKYFHLADRVITLDGGRIVA
ncbi:cyclic peptide export ABC transporter [Rhabdochromatium marinum]|uniref:cyclic peptide export ABC transporter n=1 Tax=Rhabdochromatium marinum TaxID=48729 RepID=UPI001905C5E5|nr:cyclic peptide export ABC transporter [Rhabdochromatium marinum]MBK1649049.1 hypothetical protein [Rhabdochromatium marinum]